MVGLVSNGTELLRQGREWMAHDTGCQTLLSSVHPCTCGLDQIAVRIDNYLEHYAAPQVGEIPKRPEFPHEVTVGGYIVLERAYDDLLSRYLKEREK